MGRHHLASDPRSLAEQFKDGHRLIGTVLSTPDLVLAEIVAHRFDLVWVDLEHSAIDRGEAQALVIACQAAGARCAVRVPRFDSELIGTVLDMGVDGLVAPRVESAKEAAALVDAVRYPPIGSRGFAPRRSARRAAEHDGTAARVACIAQIETARGMAAAVEIVAVAGLDGIVVGTSDLSFALEARLDPTSPKLADAVGRIGVAARSVGIPWGIAIGQLPGWVVDDSATADAAVLMYSSDVTLYAAAMDSVAAELRTVLRPALAVEGGGR